MRNQVEIDVGVVINGYRLPAWQYNILTRLIDADHVNLSIILSAQDSAPTHKILYRIFHKLDNRFLNRIPDALEITNGRNTLAGLPHIEPQASIKSPVLDFLVDLTEGPPRDEIKHLVKIGIWKHHIPANHWIIASGETPGLWLWDSTTTNWYILDQCAPSTHKISATRNTFLQYWYATDLIVRQLAYYRLHGKQAFLEMVHQSPLAATDDTPLVRTTTPSTIRIASELIPYGYRILHRFFQRLFFRDHWYILVGKQTKNSLEPAKFKPLIPPEDRFWADPFIIYKDDKHYLFLEEYLYEHDIGFISVMEVEADGTHSPPIPVLKEYYHLSHPFIFKYEDNYYMVPESGSNSTIDLYECIEFPNRWRFKKHLMEDVYTVDTTLFEHNGKWWLFTAEEQSYRGLDGDALSLYWADSPLTNRWQPHPLNPVVSDCTHSRPAGRVYLDDGKLFRPAQNSKQRYGHAISICEIVELSETTYREIVTTQIFPDWDNSILGVHTINRDGELTVIDVFQHKRRNKRPSNNRD